MGIRWTQEQYEQAIKDVRAPAMSEAEFQRRVMKVATQLGWLWYHAYDPISDAAGFPDLVLVRRKRLLFAELKTEKGKLSKEQQRWFELLNTVISDHCDVYVWRPSMMEDIVEILK
jgi:hypothetical protein